MTDNFGEPFSVQKLLVKKDILKDIVTLAGIDRGCSLTKVLYASKTSPEEDKYELNFALFENKNFEKGLEWLKKEAFLPEHGVLHVTGVGCDKYRDLIRQVLNLEIMFIDEFATQVRGSHFLLKHMDEKDYVYEDEAVDKQEIIMPDTVKAILEKMRAKFRVNVVENSKFPALFCFIGSAAGVIQINENGTSNIIGGMMFAGKSFLGLSKVILDTSNYEEIMDLASKGNAANIDTTVEDVMSQDPNSPYGSYPKDLTIMPMGKAVDNDLNAEEVKREDLANSIVGIMATVFHSLIGSACGAAGIDTIYVGGNWGKSSVARQALQKLNQNMGQNMVTIKFINTGHTGAIGAMITHESEVKKIIIPDQD